MDWSEHMNHLLENNPHRRLNKLTGEWIVVSPHRLKRPWHGEKESPRENQRPPYDPDCYLCPGNIRANRKTNPDYKQTFVFTNDFPGLLPETPLTTNSPHRLLISEGVRGTCRVVCFSPRHDLTMAEMSTSEIECVVDTWADQVAELNKSYQWIQVFENKGEIMGCSNSHPHGQIWATSVLPNEPQKEEAQQLAYYQKHGSLLLVDYAELELLEQERLVLENEYWTVVVPFWATWPFELLFLPHRSVLHLHNLSEDERKSLAEILKRTLTKLDNLFNISFPYSMGWHGAPASTGNFTHWQLHAHLYPPLLRSKNIKKYLAGYEMLAEPQRDLTAEQSASWLRSLSDIHYKTKITL